MSLYYGHDAYAGDGITIPHSNDYTTTFTYPALSTSSWAIPMDLLLGHPKPIPYLGKHMTEDTAFEVVDYTFDKDGTISNLIVEFYLVVYDVYGITYGYSLGNVDVSATMLPLSTRYISVVDKSYKLSEYHVGDWKNIVVAYIKVKKVSGSTSGNESAMTVRVIY